MNSASNARITSLLLIVWFVLASIGCTGSEDRKASFFERGKRAYEAGDFSKARLDFKNALLIDKKDAGMWVWLGKSERAAGRFSQAFGAFSEAVELEPLNVEALKNKAQLLIAAGRIEEAKGAAEKAAEMLPDDPDMLVLTGTLKQRDGDLDGAEADALAALAKAPGHIEASALSALILTNRGDAKGAEQVLNEAIALHPEALSLRVLLGRLYDKVGDYERAIGVLQSLVEVRPDSKEYRIQLASYLSRLKRNDEAEQVFRGALSAMPDDAALKIEFVEFVANIKGVPAALTAIDELMSAGDASRELRLKQASLKLRAGNEAEAEEVFRGLFANSDETPVAIRAQIQLAALLVRQGRVDEAGEQLNRVLTLSRQEPDALTLRATLALKAQDPDRAIGDLRTVLSEFPERTAVRELLGDAHRMKGDLALAQDAYEATVRLAPGRPEAYLKLAGLRVRAGDSQGALIALERLLERVPDNAQAQQAIAEIQLRAQDWDALAKTAARIRAKHPEHALGHYLDGLVAQRQKKHETAVGLFEQALKLSPEASEPLIALAESLMKLGRQNEAASRVTQVLESNPDNVVALNLMGDIKKSAGEVEQAKQWYRKAMASQAGSPRAYARIAQLLMTENNITEAVDVLNTGVEQTQRNGDLLFRLASAQEAAGQIEAAISTYEEVNSLHPKSLLTANNLAMLLASHPEPTERLDRALELAKPFRNSNSAELLDTLGWVHYQRGEYEQAIWALESAVAINGNLSEVQYHLALAYRKVGRLKDARGVLERVLAEELPFPSRSAAKQLLAELDRGSS